MESWAGWIRGNIGLLVLFVLVVLMLGFMLHVSHDKGDAGMLSWSREQTSLVLGALLGLITGRMARDPKPEEPKP